MTLNDFVELLNNHNELAADSDYGTAVDLFEVGDNITVVFTPLDSTEPEMAVLTREQMMVLVEEFTPRSKSVASKLTKLITKYDIGFCKKLTD